MKILLVGCTDSENGSKLLLDLIAPRYYIDKIYINFQSNQGEEELLARMRKKTYDYVFLFNRKSQPMEDEDQIELVLAASKGVDNLKTRLSYEPLRVQLEEQKFKVDVVQMTEETAANEFYRCSLKQAEEKDSDTRCLLINIPDTSQIDVMKFSHQLTKYFETLR